MKYFITKVKDAIYYEDDYNAAPFLMKLIIRFVELLSIPVVIVGVLVLFLTVPLWIIPYAIYYCSTKNRR